MAAFNSDEVNLLVYRYLEESGFRHSAFTFGYESNVLNAGIDSTAIPRGALMSLLQKGVLFAEAEVFSLLNDGELDGRFEKAIGCMTILECVMCEAAKAKALQRRMGIQRTAATAYPPAATPMDCDQQQQQLRTPSRVAPDQQQQNASSQLHQSGHGLTQSRPESTSSNKSSTVTFQQAHRDRADGFRTAQANSLGRGPTYRASGQAEQRLMAESAASIKCNPTLASTSAGPTSITTSSAQQQNHLHPTANAVVGGMPQHHHPFYHHQSFGGGKPSLVSMAGHPVEPTSAGGGYLTNISNGSGGNSLNGPTTVGQSIQQQIVSSTGAAFANLSNLHGGGQVTTAADISRMIGDRMLLNGTAQSYLTAANNAAGMGTKRGTGNG